MDPVEQPGLNSNSNAATEEDRPPVIASDTRVPAPSTTYPHPYNRSLAKRLTDDSSAARHVQRLPSQQKGKKRAVRIPGQIPQPRVPTTPDGGTVQADDVAMADAGPAEVNPDGGRQNVYSGAQDDPSLDQDQQSHNSGRIASGAGLQREPTLPPPDVTVTPAGRMHILQPGMSMILEATHGVRDDLAQSTPQADLHGDGRTRQPPMTEEQTAQTSGGLGSRGPVDEDEDVDMGSDEDEKMEVLHALEGNQNSNTHPSIGLHANQSAPPPAVSQQPPMTSGLPRRARPPATVEEVEDEHFAGSNHGAQPSSISHNVPLPHGHQDFASSPESNPLPGVSSPDSASQHGPTPSAAPEPGSQRGRHSSSHSGQSASGSSIPHGLHGPHGGAAGGYGPSHPGRERVFLCASKDDVQALSVTMAKMNVTMEEIKINQSKFISGQHGERRGRPAMAEEDDDDSIEPFKLDKKTKHRSPILNQFQRLVADYTRDLMKRENNKSPFTGIVVDRSEVAEFAKSKKPCCGQADFRVDIEGYPKSAWNKSAARVFAKCFLVQYPRIKKTPNKVEEAFLTHLAGLRKEYKLRQSEEEVAIRAANAKKARRDERRRRLFNERVHTVETFPQLRHHLHMLQRLGRDGMSSDDSDNELGATYVQYRVLVVPWRSKDITLWLRVIDAMSRKLQARKPLQGNRPRWRFASNAPGHRQSQKDVVTRLPKNAYDPSWLDNLDSFDIDTLDVQEEYEFRHLPDVHLAAREPHVGPAAHKKYV